MPCPRLTWAVLGEKLAGRHMTLRCLTGTDVRMPYEPASSYGIAAAPPRIGARIRARGAVGPCRRFGRTVPPPRAGSRLPNTSSGTGSVRRAVRCLSIPAVRACCERRTCRIDPPVPDSLGRQSGPGGWFCRGSALIPLGRGAPARRVSGPRRAPWIRGAAASGHRERVPPSAWRPRPHGRPGADCGVAARPHRSGRPSRRAPRDRPWGRA